MPSVGFHSPLRPADLSRQRLAPFASSVCSCSRARSLATPAVAALTPGALRLDANFHTLGVRAAFTTADGAAGNDAVVEYRRPGEPTWRTAPPAWIDVRPTLVYARRRRQLGAERGADQDLRPRARRDLRGAGDVRRDGRRRARDRRRTADDARARAARAGAPDRLRRRRERRRRQRRRERRHAEAHARRRVRDRAPPATASGSPRALLRSRRASRSPRAARRRSGSASLAGPAGRATVVVEGTGANDSVLVLAGSYVRVDGLTIRRALGSCLRIEGNTTDHWIDGNVITDWNVDDDAGVQHEGAIAAWSNATRLIVDGQSAEAPRRAARPAARRRQRRLGEEPELERHARRSARGPRQHHHRRLGRRRLGRRGRSPSAASTSTPTSTRTSSPTSRTTASRWKARTSTARSSRTSSAAAAPGSPSRRTASARSS